MSLLCFHIISVIIIMAFWHRQCHHYSDHEYDHGDQGPDLYNNDDDDHNNDQH